MMNSKYWFYVRITALIISFIAGTIGTTDKDVNDSMVMFGPYIYMIIIFLVIIIPVFIVTIVVSIGMSRKWYNKLLFPDIKLRRARWNATIKDSFNNPLQLLHDIALIFGVNAIGKFVPIIWGHNISIINSVVAAIIYAALYISILICYRVYKVGKKDCNEIDRS